MNKRTLHTFETVNPQYSHHNGQRVQITRKLPGIWGLYRVEYMRDAATFAYELDSICSFEAYATELTPNPQEQD